ncbi:unnamed protein product, partial [Notodromas monacha]
MVTTTSTARQTMNVDSQSWSRAVSSINCLHAGISSTSSREQASLTGVRLRALNLPYKLLVRSTMKRALETAELIMKEMQMGNELDVRESDLLREGAPIPPEPPVGHWRPEKH